jgi:demethylmenaquinone methyltransferase/2-methoxy-6-polyprenyl-1,4-benzoquinol methylase
MNTDKHRRQEAGGGRQEAGGSPASCVLPPASCLQGGTLLPAARVREMFGRIAPRYDLLNHLLSLEVDRWWRRRAARRFQDLLARPGARALDVCCGTGDMMAALCGRAHASAAIFGVDFSRPMLVRAKEKLGVGAPAAGRGRPARFAGGAPAFLAEVDALRLPFADGAFDLVTVAFGFRNLADYRAALREMRRVLRPGGAVGILEFSEPGRGLFGALYRFYLRRLLPRVGAAFSGDSHAYRYLQTSVAAFPSAEELAGWMRTAGFTGVEYLKLTGSIACLHTGFTAPVPSPTSRVPSGRAGDLGPGT